MIVWDSQKIIQEDLDQNTYYLNRDHLLRTHTSAHEQQCFTECKTPGYLISADVYRKDEIDRTHYPAFHQLEGARVWDRNDPNLLENIRKDIDEIPKTDIIVEDEFRETQSPKTIQIKNI